MPVGVSWPGLPGADGRETDLDAVAVHVGPLFARLTTTAMGPSGATPGLQTNSPGLSAAGAVSTGSTPWRPRREPRRQAARQREATGAQEGDEAIGILRGKCFGPDDALLRRDGLRRKSVVPRFAGRGQWTDEAAAGSADRSVEPRRPAGRVPFRGDRRGSGPGNDTVARVDLEIHRAHLSVRREPGRRHRRRRDGLIGTRNDSSAWRARSAGGAGRSARPTSSSASVTCRAAAAPTDSLPFQLSSCRSRLRTWGFTHSSKPGLSRVNASRTRWISACRSRCSGDPSNAWICSCVQLHRSAR